jgi:hypothetical protein
MLLGSCFTENIGKTMVNRKLPALVNPFGVIYNPISVNLVLKRIIQGKPYGNDELTHYNNQWISLNHHTSFSKPNQAECLEEINLSLSNAHNFWQKTQRLIITFGTARVFYLAKTGKPVANCHKIPAKEFTRKLLSTEEIVDVWKSEFEEILREKPNLKVILTVSPVRHWKDGSEGNQLSKATLILAINRLIEIFPNNLVYFPTYEIVMDDLRDYRFYNDDMLHPSPLAVEYIWEKFKDSLIPQPAQQLMGEVEKIYQAVNHKPFSTKTKEFKQFIKNTLLKIEAIAQRNPNINFTHEVDLLNSYLCT